MMTDQEYDELNTRLHAEIRVDKPEYIICAANWYDDGTEHVHEPVKSGFVVCGRRHHNIFATVATLLESSRMAIVALNNVCAQGFMTSKNRWVTREEAGKIALAAGQIKKETPCLFSEDLY